MQTNETVFAGLTYPNGTVGVKEITKTVTADISIQPNPVKSSFSISVKNTEESKNNYYSIYDTKGNLIAYSAMDKITGDFTQLVDITNYTSGLYLVAVSINGKITTKKIIKE